ncbi:glycosyltransferase family 4 protein [bacterium]|nr:glycosyltransferase family 4 protein [bacterium]
MKTSSARRPYRVLYLSLFGDLSRGGQNSILLLLNGLDRNRVEPILVVPKEGNLAERACELDIPVHVVPWTRFRTLNLVQIGRSVLALWRVLKQVKPDIIHTDSPRNSHLSAMMKGGAKLLVHLRVSTPDGLSDRFLAAESDAMIAVSEGAALRFKGYPQKIQQKIFRVPNAVHVDRFVPVDEDVRKQLRNEMNLPQDKPVVAFLASYDPVKRHDFFLELWPEVVKRVPDATLALAGKGLDEAWAKWEHHLRQQGAAESMKVLSFVDQPAQFLAASDLLVLPSSEEGFPRAAIEAAACGLPCVVSDLPGVREGIDDGTTGVAVPANDPSAWVDALVNLLEDEKKRQKMGRKAVEYVREHFSAESHADRVMAIYDQVLGVSF